MDKKKHTKIPFGRKTIQSIRRGEKDVKAGRLISWQDLKAQLKI